MSTLAESGPVQASKIRLARALVDDATRHGRTEEPWVIKLAQRPLPEDKKAR